MTSMPTDGVELVEREHPAGSLRFESFPKGTWLTKKGEPAKTAKRGYFLGDRELDSVSSIVETLDKPALIRWYEDHSARGAVQAERMGELAGVPPEEFAARVKALGLGPSAARDEGAARGTAIHAVFEEFAASGEPPNPADFHEMWHPWVQGATRAWLALQCSPRLTEHMVCHPDLGYAGRLDLLGSTPGADVTVVDYKTGKGRVYEQAHYQSRLYAMAYEAETGTTVDRIVIVGVDDTGDFQLVECEATEEDALHLLWTFRGRKRINAGMAAQRKTAKKANA